MQPLYLFDVDGTLTQPSQPITEDFAAVFLEWMEDNDARVYLVTGNDIKKTKIQVFEEFLYCCDGVFTCSGNQLWEQETLVHQNKFRAPKGLIKDLELYLENAQYSIRTGNHIERRGGMINFSVLGRNANLLQRQSYAKWDLAAREREDVVDYIKTNYPRLDVSIGGEISVDIYPRGKDKSQVAPYLRKKYGKDVPLIFVGDKNIPGGNDYPLSQLLEEHPECHWFQVNSYQETWALIEHSKLFIGEGGI